MAEYRVGAESEIAEGGRKVVQCGDAEIGIFRFQGQLHAWHNRCPHREGPVCQGRLIHRVIEPVAAGGTVRTLDYDDDHLHIICPWHGYEFDVADGTTVGAAKTMRLRSAKLRVEDGEVYVVL
jgi:nitrite reductase/ring-hydroxylating ferredoxin subunit